jgi:hypothetical protein
MPDDVSVKAIKDRIVIEAKRRGEPGAVSLILEHEAAVRLATGLMRLVASATDKEWKSKPPFEQSVKTLLQDPAIQTGTDGLGRVVIGFRSPVFPAILVALPPAKTAFLRRKLDEMHGDLRGTTRKRGRAQRPKTN